MIKLSVIVTAYNVERYIHETVQSILDQTLSEIEIIVVDDGSTDDTRHVVESLCDQDARVVLVSQENGGVSAARNFGLKLATGEFILFVDGDDMLLPSACEQMLGVAVAEDADMVVSDFLYKEEHEEKLYPMKGGDFQAMNGLDFGKLLLQPFFRIAVWNKLVRRSLYGGNAVQFPIGISMGEDLVTVFELSCRARKVAKLNVATIVYLKRAGSLVRTGSSHWVSIVEAMSKLEELIVRYYGDNAEARTLFRTACYFYVMYSRVIGGSAYGPIHRHLYDWYRRHVADKGGMEVPDFMRGRTFRERILARGYQNSYAVGFALSRAADLAKAVK